MSGVFTSAVVYLVVALATWVVFGLSPRLREAVELRPVDPDTGADCTNFNIFGVAVLSVLWPVGLGVVLLMTVLVWASKLLMLAWRQQPPPKDDKGGGAYR